MSVFLFAKTIFKKIYIHIYFHSWYCKNMNRSQAEKLLKTEVNSMSDTIHIVTKQL